MFVGGVDLARSPPLEYLENPWGFSWSYFKIMYAENDDIVAVGCFNPISLPPLETTST